jgi:hypothetical protein
MFEKSRFEKPEDRFRSVDFLAAKIFDAMPDLTVSDPSEEASSNSSCNSADIGNLLANENRTQKSGSPIADSRGNTLLRALVELNKVARLGLQQSGDSDFLAGPGGAEVLRGKPDARSDEEMLASIRSLIEAEKQETEQQMQADPKSEASKSIAENVETENDPLSELPQDDIPEPDQNARSHGVFAKIFRKPTP